MKKLPKDRKPRAKFKGCTREQFLGYCVKNNNGLGYLYIVKLSNDTETFIKIGITSRKVEERMKELPYNSDILYVLEGKSSYIYDLEHSLKKQYVSYKYIPFLKFGGRYECFSTKLLEVIVMIQI